MHSIIIGDRIKSSIKKRRKPQYIGWEIKKHKKTKKSVDKRGIR